jgi:YopX protein
VENYLTIKIMEQKQIKFRIWNGSQMEYNVIAGKFGAFYVNPGDKGDGLNPKDTACLTIFNTKYWEQMPVMQWTGQKDKNGVDIYECDMFRERTEHDSGDKYQYFICIWIAELGRFAWLTPEEKFDYETLTNIEEFLTQNNDLGMDYSDNNKISIIGNTYTHKTNIQDEINGN